MENWQLTLIVLASVFVGALIPLLIMTAMAVYRAGRALAEIGVQLKRTLSKLETVSDRVEVLSRGFEGKETNIADLLTTVGNLSRSIDRNMKIIDMFSAIAASVGMLISSLAKTRNPVKETENNHTPDDGEGKETGVARRDSTGL